MPLARLLWDYTPFASFVSQPAIGAGGAIMSAPPGSSPTVYGRLAGADAFAGDTSPMFGAELYNRIHYSTLAIDLGNLVGDQQRVITVWNAYRRARTLEDVVLTGGEGITLTAEPGEVLPFQYGPLQLRSYQIAAGTSGPPTVEATLLFDFDLGESETIEITGARVTAWTWPPDWAQSMLERLEWRTDVLRAYRGQEQARALRINPRQAVEFTVTAEGDARRHMEAVLWNWAARVFAVPLWHDGLELEAPLLGGSTSIPLDPAMRDFRVGALVLLLGETARDFEVVEVASVAGAAIGLVRPTLQAWPTGTRVYPARTARLSDETSLPRFTGQASTARLRFEMVEPAEWTADAGPLYRGYPVLEERPDWADDLDMSTQRKLAVLDSGIGPVEVEDEAQMPFTAQRMRWILRDRTELDAYRKRLFALRGKQGRIWVPTWSQDLAPVAGMSSVATNIDVRWCGYTTYQALAVNRRDLRIELADGTVLYRRITGSVELDADTERLTIDAALGVTVPADGFALVSFLSLARQDSDAAELAWFTGDAAESAATLRSLRHDV